MSIALAPAASRTLLELIAKLLAHEVLLQVAIVEGRELTREQWRELDDDILVARGRLRAAAAPMEGDRR